MAPITDTHTRITVISSSRTIIYPVIRLRSGFGRTARAASPPHTGRAGGTGRKAARRRPRDCCDRRDHVCSVLPPRRPALNLGQNKNCGRAKMRMRQDRGPGFFQVSPPLGQSRDVSSIRGAYRGAAKGSNGGNRSRWYLGRPLKQPLTRVDPYQCCRANGSTSLRLLIQRRNSRHAYAEVYTCFGCTDARRWCCSRHCPRSGTT